MIRISLLKQILKSKEVIDEYVHISKRNLSFNDSFVYNLSFSSHLIAEMSFKIFIMSQNVLPEKTHDLISLCHSRMKYEVGFNDFVDEMNYLTDYNTSGRYPREYDSLPGREQIVSDFRLACKIFEFVSGKVDFKEIENRLRISEPK